MLRVRISHVKLKVVNKSTRIISPLNTIFYKGALRYSGGFTGRSYRNGKKVGYRSLSRKEGKQIIDIAKQNFTNISNFYYAGFVGGVLVMFAQHKSSAWDDLTVKLPDEYKSHRGGTMGDFLLHNYKLVDLPFGLRFLILEVEPHEIRFVKSSRSFDTKGDQVFKNLDQKP